MSRAKPTQKCSQKPMIVDVQNRQAIKYEDQSTVFPPSPENGVILSSRSHEKARENHMHTSFNQREMLHSDSDHRPSSNGDGQNPLLPGACGEQGRENFSPSMLQF